MAKVLTFIGLGAIALGVLFMAAGFYAGGTWLFLLAAQVGLPAVISGIVFMAFGYVVELLEAISKASRQANEIARDANKAKTSITLRLEDVAGPVRVLRSIGDVLGGLNDKQRSAVVDFVGYSTGGALSHEQRQEVGAWVEVTSAHLETDLQNLRLMSPAQQRRFQSAIGVVASGSGVMHSAGEAKTKVENALARISQAMTT